MTRPIRWSFSVLRLLAAIAYLGDELSHVLAGESDLPIPRAALRSRPTGSQSQRTADLIVLAGRVWTGDPAKPWAEGVAALAGAIVKVGSRDEILRLKDPRTLVIDRPGAFALPGLIDAHGHVESLGASLERVDLRGVSSLDEVARRVRTRVESTPGDSWIVARLVPPASPQDLKRRILAAQQHLLAAGLTGVHDAGISRAVVRIYRNLDRSRQLRLRVYGMATLPAGQEVQFVSQPPRKATPGDRFEMRAVKVFIDGAMGSRGALLFRPYEDDPANQGLLLIDPKVLEATTVAALRHGWQVATHAIGDRGNALVLDAYEAALKAVPEARDARLRVQHAQVVRREDVRRFAELGIIASMQPAHASSDMRWADARLGPGRVDGAYAWQWFLDAKVPLAFGSDFPVEIVNPFWGLYAAITRQDADGKLPGGWHPEQRMTVEEALRGFTSGSAFAAFAEDRLGMFKVGMQADLTLVEQDLFDARPGRSSRRTSSRPSSRVKSSSNARVHNRDARCTIWLNGRVCEDSLSYPLNSKVDRRCACGYQSHLRSK